MKLVITVGLPGAGKTTYARRWVAESPASRSRSNRDDLGTLMHGGRFHGDPALSDPTEKAITVAQLAQIRALLEADRDVICDDTNLNADVIQQLEQIAHEVGAAVEVVDMLSVPLETVLARNARRAGTPAFVPEQVIRSKYERYTGPERAAA